MSFFLRSKKRDLSDKSKDGEDSKKVKESNSLSSLPDEFFSYKLIINCLKSIENQVNELFTFHKEAKESQIKVTELLDFMSTKFDDLEKEIKKKDEKINQLEKNFENLVEKHKSHSSEIDDLEQYSWRNCLVLHGFNESNDGNTNEIIIKTFSKELGVKIKEDDLTRSHRLGKSKRKDNKPRPIIVKFTRYAVWREIFMNKRKLKGKPLLITESLTSSRMHLLGDAHRKYGVRNVWASDSCVMVKENNKFFLYKS